jgi:hypothetical protein
MDLTISVDVTGPMFDGHAKRAAHDYLDKALMDIGQQGMADVHLMLDQSIRNPTPYYETQITVERAGSDVVVHDRGVVYGPWLEGVGSRNYPATRFAGYHSFRRAFQQLDRKAEQIATHALPSFLARMQ